MASSSLEARLDAVRKASSLSGALIDRLGAHLRSASDEDLFRMNPLAWAAANEATERESIDLFLHATRAGLLDFAWGIVCPGCAAFIQTSAGLRAVIEQQSCALCEMVSSKELDDNVEVTFNVSPAVRHTRFHDLGPDDYRRDAALVFASRWGISGPITRAFLERTLVIAERTAAGSSITRRERIDRGRFVALSPDLHVAARFEVVPEGAPLQAEIEILGTSVLAPAVIGQGTVEFHIHNRTGAQGDLLILPDMQFLMRDNPEAHAELAKAFPKGPPAFTGRRLVTSQTFRDLFRAESIPPEFGLQVRSLSMLFTDLKGSTQLYERVGDLRAFELVRRHFDVLREIVAAHDGAVVKTIGDAVMASFHDPVPALAAAAAMQRRIAEVGNGELMLKVGLHDGPCIAVTLNDRLDYFGQTVNIAARVQGLASAGEIVVTGSTFSHPGMESLLGQAELAAARATAPLKGIDAPVDVVRLTR